MSEYCRGAMHTALGGHVRDVARAVFSVIGRTCEVILGMLPVATQSHGHDNRRSLANAAWNMELMSGNSSEPHAADMSLLE